MQTPAPEHDAEYLAAYLDQSRQIMRDLQAARAAIRQVEGRAESGDSLVMAVADGQGGLTRLRIDPRALRLSERELGRKVTAVLQEAQANAERQAMEIADKVKGKALPEPLDETFIRQRVEQATRDLLL
ncbi:YbaB/EbfC family nucleoid-associated protein [Nonomuraea sp. NPDC049480]|uniref:YbaB/EbfC family nucleoid-associated protein n=1 Tax=Nonomuraea sp. NPDC049480 TaxID=3364353 RepID=UPI0037B263F6